jgi:hypothetical protein
MGAEWADYDNDGWLDLVVSTYGENVLYHNNGDGTFSDRTRAAGLAENGGSGRAWPGPITTGMGFSICT